ncbi:Peptidase family M48 [Lutibacter oricola]|uniref:Peptidase family M48 n=1 Tax=Lutibacter oricola TaxID=762486 RepID=A0A1H2W096_9FLAO|nr:M48 family metalloprotease [Lutibacter oricola]SDW73857.1 Peptidase family M48 [Lutibacter oricola]
MNKYHNIVFLVLLIVVNSCNTSSGITNENEQVLSNKDLLIKTYSEVVIPLFKQFDVEIPTDFVVDEKDLTINAGASFGYVEVSKGLINSNKRDVQIFVLAHELAHIVTLKQASLFNLKGSIPKGTETNDYQKSEYLADLIAFHLINTKLTDQNEALILNFNYLESLFGPQSFTHPSGINRIKFLNEYLSMCNGVNNNEIFKLLFIKIWKMD